jgi:hypothetical protein
MVTQHNNEYQKQVDEVIEEAGEFGMPRIPEFLFRKKPIERVKRKEKTPT